MGSGAGKRGGKSAAYASEEQKVEPEEFSDDGHREVVLAQATRPDWAMPDYLVFQPQNEEDVGAGQEFAGPWTQKSVYEKPIDPETIAEKMTTEEDNHRKAQERQKGGRFYSKNNQAVGTWRMLGNVLTIIWGHTARNDTAICTKTARRWVNAVTRLNISVMEPKVNPPWFTPSMVAQKFRMETVSMKQFECPVCYFELYQFTPGVIRMHSRRVCGHYFHKQCAHYLLRLVKGTKSPACCPICGVEFSEVKEMPDLARDPREWFAICDIDFGGELEEVEVIEALGAILPVSRHKLTKSVRAHWHEWDPDGDGTITMQEFVAPERGLRDWILKNLSQLRVDLQPLPGMVPSIDRNPREWFHYWDRDASGTLEKEEVIRALIRTFCRNENGRPVLQNAHDMRECANSLWEGLGYRPFDGIGFEEFVRPYGLCDQFLHNQTHCTYFGEDCENVHGMV